MKTQMNPLPYTKRNSNGKLRAKEFLTSTCLKTLFSQVVNDSKKASLLFAGRSNHSVLKENLVCRSYLTCSRTAVPPPAPASHVKIIPCFAKHSFKLCDV